MILWEWEKDSILYSKSPYIPTRDIFQAVCSEIGRYYQGKGWQYIKSKRELKWKGSNLWCKFGLWSSHSNIRGEWVNLEIVASVFARDLSGMERKGILNVGLRPKNFNVYQIDLELFRAIIRYIDSTIQFVGEIDTRDGLERFLLAASKENFVATNPNNLQYVKKLLGTDASSKT